MSTSNLSMIWTSKTRVFSFVKMGKMLGENSPTEVMLLLCLLGKNYNQKNIMTSHKNAFIPTRSNLDHIAVAYLLTTKLSFWQRQIAKCLDVAKRVESGTKPQLGLKHWAIICMKNCPDVVYIQYSIKVDTLIMFDYKIESFFSKYQEIIIYWKINMGHPFDILLIFERQML